MEVKIVKKQEVNKEPLERRIAKIEKTIFNIKGSSKYVEVMRTDSLTDYQKNLYEKYLTNTLNINDNTIMGFYESPTGIMRHPQEWLYRKGIIQLNKKRLVRIDLNLCFNRLIQLFCNMEDANLPDLSPTFLLERRQEIMDLICGDIDVDTMRDLFIDLLETNNPIVCGYLEALADRKHLDKVYIYDIYDTKYELTKTEIGDMFLAPLALSYKNFIYDIVDEMHQHYRRGDKRLAMIDSNQLYYLVSDNVFEEFMSMKFKIRDLELFIPIEEIKFDLDN